MNDIDIYDDLIELRYIDSEEVDKAFDISFRNIEDPGYAKKFFDLGFEDFEDFLRFGELLALYLPNVSLIILRERWDENDNYDLEVSDYDLNSHLQIGGFSSWNRYTNYPYHRKIYI